MIRLVLIDIDGVITDGKVQINGEGQEIKKLDFKDIDAIFELKKKGYKIGIITGEDTPIVKYFNDRFKPHYFYFNCKDKVSKIKEIQRKDGFKNDEICFIGDSKHDIDAIKYVGLGVCPNNASSNVKDVADITLKSSGGGGCIQELLDLLNQYKEKKYLFFSKGYQEHMDVFNKIRMDKQLQDNVTMIAEEIIKTLKNGGKILLCGNGGSAADSQHIAAEFVGRFYLERKALNAEALTVNSSSLTSIGNDYDFKQVFARQVEAKGKQGDMIIGISTSGNSMNIMEALKTAKQMKLRTVALIGDNKNTPIAKFADIVINVPSNITPRIQEAHIFIGHLICEYVEYKLFNKNKKTKY
ncbi:MAG: HAD-IA family hydrolase [Candidatus Ratteibacteria bacterium]|nr:HAD-IA family hydrolase [Candidatus Ratteibacteria bacterium]